MVDYYILGCRGIWTGFARGFFRQENITLSKECMDPDLLNDELMYISSYMQGYGDFYGILEFGTMVTRVVDQSFTSCGYSEVVWRLMQFCQKVTGRCGFDQILKNAGSCIIGLLGDLNGLIAQLIDFRIEEPEDLYLRAMAFGVNSGKIVKAIFAYDDNSLH